MGENQEPIKRKRGFEYYIGELPEPKRAKVDNVLKNKYSHEVWQRYASPVWFDIRQTNVLNYRIARGEKDEKHICPLQLDVIERAVHLWTNPNDLVFTPFAGIGSEVYGAVKAGRRGLGFELKPEYYEKAIKFMESLEVAEREKQRTLF